MLNIRRISHREKQIGEWQQRFQQDLAPHIPQVGERYFQITLNSEKQQIQVLVNAEDWCRHRWPKLAHYAWDLLDAKSLCKVFTYENTGNAFFSEQFRCHHVEIIDDEQPQQPWLTVKEKALGIVLLAEPISGLKEIKPINGLSDTLKLQADWILGYSHISGKTLQSIALRDVPSTMALNGIALLLSIFVMMPVLQDVNQYMRHESVDFSNVESVDNFVDNGLGRYKSYLMKYSDPQLVTFFESVQQGKTEIEVQEEQAEPTLFSLLPAYALSEIKSAFEIGFYIYLPFVVIDLVISSILLALGMMMMSPVTISVPVKLILFVAIDGWSLISKGLVMQYFELAQH